MIRAVQNGAVGLALVIVVATAAGCSAYAGPLDVPAGTEVDPEPYVGVWNVREFLGQSPGEAITATLDLSAGELEATFEDHEQSFTYSSVILTRVLTRTTFAVMDESKPGAEMWTIGSLELNESTGELAIMPLSNETVKEAIKTDVLSGTVYFLSQREQISVKAAGAELRAFLENNPAAFVESRSPVMLLSRVEQEAMPASAMARLRLVARMLAGAVAAGIGLLGITAAYLRGRAR